MKKQFAIITSVIMMLATVSGFAGTRCGYDRCAQPQPVCYPAYETAVAPVSCQPVCPPVCAPRPVRAPACPPVCPPTASAKASNSSNLSCDGVIVTATQPQLCYLGDNYALDIEAKACMDVCHVEINALLPEGVSLVRSEPDVLDVKGSTLTWNIDAMRKGDVKRVRVILRADREGDLCVCFCVTAVPVKFCALICAKPILECTKCGPAQVCPGDPVHYTVTVTNKGSCAAEEVVVTDLVPDGLKHESGMNTLVYKLGTIRSGETKTIENCFTAVKRGMTCNRVNVTACNANPVGCEFCTCVCCCLVEIVKTGPKEVPIGKVADYVITATNTGDIDLTDVVVTDNAPESTSIVEAKGATVTGNKAVWAFPELKSGEKRSFNISLTTCIPGYFVNHADIDNCQNCTARTEFGTRWKGRPALSMCFEAEEPICIGQPVTFIFKVSNPGTEEDTNVKLSVEFPKEVAPLKAYGASKGTVSNGVVTFDAIPILGPRRTVEFRVEGRGEQSGDGRIRAKIWSDSVTTPINVEESQIVN